MRRLLTFILFLPVLYVVGGLGAQEYAFRSGVGASVEVVRARMRKHLQAYLDDQKALASLDLFRAKPGGRDAAPYLRGKLKWAGERGEGRTVASERKELLELPAPVVQKVEQWATWPAEAETFDYRGIDFSWLKELGAYDLWDSDGEPRTQALLGKVRAGKIHFMTYLSNTQFPEVKSLVHWARLRLGLGLQEKNLQPALSEVRHLAGLLYSTESLAGELLAVALLGIERKAYEHGVSRGVFIASAWTPLSAELQKRLQRAVWGGWGFFSPLAPLEVLQAAFGREAGGIGRCGAIVQGTLSAAAVDRHLRGTFPLERDFSPVMAMLRKIALDPTNGCRLKEIRAYWAEPEKFPTWWAEIEDSSAIFAKSGDALWIQLELAAFPLPYVRRVAGAMLATIGNPTALRHYEE